MPLAVRTTWYRHRLLLVNGALLAVIGMGVALLAFLGLTVILGGLEERLASRNVGQAERILERERTNLKVTVRDWACWDETYGFMGGQNPGYVETNFLPDEFGRLSVSFLLLMSEDGRIVWSGGFQNGVLKPAPSGLESLARWLLSSPDGTRSGLCLLEGVPCLLASHPILTSRFQGPRRGVMIMGRPVDAVFRNDLSRMLGLLFFLDPLPRPGSSRPFSDLGLLGTGEETFRVLGEDRMAGFRVLADWTGHPAFLLQVAADRTIYHEGRRVVLFFLGWLFVSGLFYAAFSFRQGLRMERTNRILAEGQDCFRTLVDCLGEGIVIVDPEELITFANTSAERLFGVERGKLVGHNFAEYLDEATLHRVSTETEARRAGRTSTYELRVHRPDGKTTDLSITVSPVRDEVGGFRAAIGVFRDVSEQKMLQSQLVQSQKMEAMGKLAGGVAHDFNNVLTVILGNAQILREELQSQPELLRTCEAVVAAAEQASGLTRQLLVLARKGIPQRVPIDLHMLVGQVLQILSRSLDRRITIRQALRAPCSGTMGDPAQIQNALLNLALNARDAMPEGGELTFSSDLVRLGDHSPAVLNGLAPGDYLRLQVADTGCGIGKEDLPHVFEPFFTTKDLGQGTGLGLAAVYSCMQQHCGSVDVESEEGRGTVFSLLFPSSPSSLPLREGEASRWAGEARRGAGHILFVDDEEAIRSFAVRVLGQAGYTVSTCMDGQEAVEWVQAHPGLANLVILDLSMPRMGGREAVSQIRVWDKKVPILLSTGHFAEEVEGNLPEGAVYGVLQKPFQIGVFLDLVVRALGRVQEERRGP